MDKNTYKIDQSLFLTEPAKDILSGVFRQIENINRRVFIWRIVSNIGLSVFSASGIFVFAKYIGQAMNTSGLLDFLRLAITDSSVVTQNFGDFMSAVTESFPVLEMFFVSVISLLFIIGLVGIVKNLRQFRRLDTLLIA